ncbi:CP family cyanate transporter-like MFS transporter [Gramella sp. Hel_I_59]|uniref:CynX/NimT family MFS transporter n=1 Tax=Gramella sp. Hel_I_59 TaxID=1249978 RepID=UPI00114FA1F0|nr:MFS transporter [Gramella sp. Hel_I_59]TQI71133.1 CP family cyanate transporter-like MFS transporter [Gramella sp. Hel_I_59]
MRLSFQYSRKIKKDKSSKSIPWSINSKGLLLLLGVIFMASNLRAPLTSVGPVVDEISKALSLSNTAAGLITTIPLIAFSLLSGIIPKFSKKYGMELVLLWSLILLSIGLTFRSLGSIVTLFLGAGLVGAAITVGNVLMPAFIKNKFPNHIGAMMGVYSVMMNLTAALAAGFSITLGNISGLGWKGSIGIWLVLSLICIPIWLPQVKENRKATKLKVSTERSVTNLYKSRLAWAITVFMGVQSLMYYCLAAWLPKIMQTWGMAEGDSGWILSYVHFAQLPMALFGAIIAGKMKNQKLLAVIIGVLYATGIVGILFFKTEYIVLWSILIGLASGLAYSLSMLYLVLRTKNTTQATEMSGMAQGFGYLIAACGPPLFGASFDITQSWIFSLVLLLVMCFILCFTGIIAGKATQIE